MKVNLLDACQARIIFQIMRGRELEWFHVWLYDGINSGHS